jgi:hypothetical protein
MINFGMEVRNQGHALAPRSQPNQESVGTDTGGNGKQGETEKAADWK